MVWLGDGDIVGNVGIVRIGYTFSRDIEIKIIWAIIVIYDSLTSILIDIINMINILTCITDIANITGSDIIHLIHKIWRLWVLGWRDHIEIR